MFRLYTPKNLNLKNLLSNAGKSARREKHIERYKYVVSFIIYNTLSGKYKDRKHPFINICQATIRDIIGRKLCVEVFSDLTKWGVIESDGKAKVNSKCLGYRLTSEYHKESIQEDIVVDMKLWDNINRLTKRNVSALFQNKPHLKILYDHLKRVQIDYPSAKEFISVQYNIDADKYNSRFLAIGRLHQNDLFFMRDTFGNRLHTNLSSFPKDLRKFLVVKDNASNSKISLVELDIKNSQPLFLLVYLLKYHKGEIDVKELIRYRQIIQSGFYEFFMRELNIADRKQAKNQVYSKLLFNKTIASKLTPFEVLFKSHFPTIFDVLFEVKKKDYKKIASLMQQVESAYIVDTIAKKYTSQYPDAFIATIHDSIIIEQKYATEYLKKMKGKLMDKYGIDPDIHINQL